MDVKHHACPFCGEQILVAAKKCKHCGEWVQRPASPQRLANEGEASELPGDRAQPEPKGAIRWVRLAVVAIVMFVVALLVASLTDNILDTAAAERIARREGHGLTGADILEMVRLLGGGDDINLGAKIVFWVIWLGGTAAIGIRRQEIRTGTDSNDDLLEYESSLTAQRRSSLRFVAILVVSCGAVAGVAYGVSAYRNSPWRGAEAILGAFNSGDFGSVLALYGPDGMKQAMEICRYRQANGPENWPKAVGVDCTRAEADLRLLLGKLKRGPGLRIVRIDVTRDTRFILGGAVALVAPPDWDGSNGGLEELVLREDGETKKWIPSAEVLVPRMTLPRAMRWADR